MRHFKKKIHTEKKYQPKNHTINTIREDILDSPHYVRIIPFKLFYPSIYKRQACFIRNRHVKLGVMRGVKVGQLENGVENDFHVEFIWEPSILKIS